MSTDNSSCGVQRMPAPQRNSPASDALAEFLFTYSICTGYAESSMSSKSLNQATTAALFFPDAPMPHHSQRAGLRPEVEATVEVLGFKN